MAGLGPVAALLLDRLADTLAEAAVGLPDPRLLPESCRRAVLVGWGDAAEAPGARASRVNAEARGLLDAVAAGRLDRLVVISSTLVYGAHADNPVPLDESAPLRAATAAGGVVPDLLGVEAVVAAAQGCEGRVSVLRPACLLGVGMPGLLSEHLAAPRLLVLRGAAPLWQVCHADDLLSATALLLSTPAPLPREAVVASGGWLDQPALEAASGRRRLELPAAVAEATAARLRRARLVDAGDELPYLRHPWVTSVHRLPSLGWAPSRSAEEAVRAHVAAVEGFGSGALRAGATGATVAGATAAVVGTAALLRRARARRAR